MPKLTARHYRLITILAILFFIVVGVSTYAVFADDQVENAGPSEISDFGKGGVESSLAYHLRPSDLVAVKIYGQSDLSIEQRIDGNGFIQMPLLGKVRVGNLSIRESENLIETQFVEQRYLRTPQASVHVVNYAPKSVSVFGEVKNPGKIDFELEMNRMDIVEVIALAGDFTGIAKKGDLIVTRVNSETGKEEKHTVDVQKKIVGNSKNESVFWVYPGDVIYVPESLF